MAGTASYSFTQKEREVGLRKLKRELKQRSWGGRKKEKKRKKKKREKGKREKETKEKRKKKKKKRNGRVRFGVSSF